MVKIELILDDKTWLCYITKVEIKKITKKVFNSVISTLRISVTKGTVVELSVILTNDDIIRNYNKNYRNNNKPTNVLSFPIYEKEIIEELKHENNYILLGDIILSLNTIVDESKKQEKLFSDHLTHIMVHSILHLFGFDHISDSEADVMENLEIEVLKKLKINNPYK